MHAPIELMIAEDMQPIREYLGLILSNEPDMKVLDSVSTGAAAVTRGLELQPKVILMDLEMESPRAGVEAIQTLAVEAPEIRCVVLTHFCDDETVFAAFEAGAVDYILKNSSAVDILEAIRAAAQGTSVIRPQIARMLREEFRTMRMERMSLVSTLNIVYKLTPTELGILRMLAEGKSKSEISDIRHIEASTVRTHVGNILKKFNKPNIQEVVTLLKRLDIFEIFVKGEDEYS